MAAGLGFKTFTTGEVLTAADTNGYLMQGINVFASTAGRDAAITSPQEGQFAYTKDTNSLWYYTGLAWAASGATGDIEGVTAGTGISGGGTSGTVTITNSMATEIAAKGDLIVGTGAATFDNLTVGANDTILVADSSTATGLKWAAPAAPAFVGAYAYRTTDLAIAATTDTIITLPSEDFDTDAFHSTSSNTGRMTVPAGKAGKYAFDAYAFLSTSPGAYGRLRIYKNGTAVGLGLKDGTLQGLDGFGFLSAQGSIVLNLAVADYVEIGFYTQNACTCAFAYLSAQFLGV